MKAFLACLAVLLSLPLRIAGAQPAPDGYLIAGRACAATTSIRGEGDGKVLDAGRAYRLIAGNKVPATHYLIELPGASPARRWVESSCGERVASVRDGPAAPAGTAAAKDASGVSTRNILAISWQPAFCEGLSNKAECRSQTAERADASRFSLHGLWPQPRTREYCGEAAAYKDEKGSAGWRDLPAPQLSAGLRTRLETAMPGTQSFLDRHEWTRHGTCYGRDAEAYFGGMIALLDAVNASPVAELFKSRIGREVTAQEIRAAFDKAFGAGAGERVRVSCRTDGDRRLVDELTVGLVGAIGTPPDMRGLLDAARPTKAGCPGGIVDAVGIQ